MWRPRVFGKFHMPAGAKQLFRDRLAGGRSLHRNAGYFDIHIFWQPAYLHRFPRRRLIGKVGTIYLIYLGKIIHICQKDSALNDVRKIQSRCFQYFAQFP